MRFTIVYIPIAQQELADVWMASPDRNGVTLASNRIDQILAVDPESKGDYLYDTARALIVSPLGVEFEVDVDDGQVRILSVWDANLGRPDPTGN